MSKLNPEDLNVSSFQTSAEADALAPITTGTSYDPTAMTYCFVCPPRTFDGCTIAAVER